ncbi:hypothetical protein [Sphingobacterium suaedae]|uniref:Uncharacterized protein n=1 Tax=Sphingobacterium suaedae TaxID=1686402 RepID=A0ABW5KMA5_9SPHI
MKKKLKKQYVSPTFSIQEIELECGIAAGSATARPENSDIEVYEQWQVEPDDNRIINW